MSTITSSSSNAMSSKTALHHQRKPSAPRISTTHATPPSSSSSSKNPVRPFLSMNSSLSHPPSSKSPKSFTEPEEKSTSPGRLQVFRSSVRQSETSALTRIRDSSSREPSETRQSLDAARSSSINARNLQASRVRSRTLSTTRTVSPASSVKSARLPVKTNTDLLSPKPQSRRISFGSSQNSPSSSIIPTLSKPKLNIRTDANVMTERTSSLRSAPIKSQTNIATKPSPPLPPPRRSSLTASQKLADASNVNINKVTVVVAAKEDQKKPSARQRSNTTNNRTKSLNANEQQWSLLSSGSSTVNPLLKENSEVSLRLLSKGRIQQSPSSLLEAELPTRRSSFGTQIYGASSASTANIGSKLSLLSSNAASASTAILTPRSSKRESQDSSSVKSFRLEKSASLLSLPNAILSKNTSLRNSIGGDAGIATAATTTTTTKRRSEVPSGGGNETTITKDQYRRNVKSMSGDPSKYGEPVEVPRISEPLTPQEVINQYGDQLSPYERGEILEYPHVYYFGRLNRKPQSRSSINQNFGYDDDRGDYLVHIRDHLQYRYEIVEVLGRGSFGQVVRSKDHKRNEMVAIKIIRNKKRFHTQALVEVKILDNLRKWDPNDEYNVIQMTDHFYFRNHLCIVFECLSLNLYEFIKQNQFRGFSLGLIRRFTSQILQSLKLLSLHEVVHCDLKPENVLLKHPNKSAIKVIDFGSSCLQNERVYTYIQSRFYRSPEVILGMDYGMPIDMWSLGCIVAELYTGYPIFPGEDEHQQLGLMMEVLGLPPTHILEKSSRKSTFFDSQGNVIPPTDKQQRRRPASKSLRQVLRCQDERFMDFIARCLEWDPLRRLRPGEGLKHEWITDSPTPDRSSSMSLKDAALSAARKMAENGSTEDFSAYLLSSQSSKPTPVASAGGGGGGGRRSAAVKSSSSSSLRPHGSRNASSSREAYNSSKNDSKRGVSKSRKKI